jgi:hypothetical protein
MAVLIMMRRTISICGLFINLFSRQHLALDYQLHASFPRKVMLLSLVIPYSLLFSPFFADHATNNKIK